eukprot:jgi/Tetstr1/425277/TSEL_015729.t1
MESDDPAVAAMHLAYAATFDPSVCVCALACGRRSANLRRLLPQPPMMPPSRPRTARWCATRDVYRMMPRTPLREAAEGGAGAAADGVPPAVVDAHRRAAKLTAVQELRRARHALDTADLEAAEGGAGAAADGVPPAVVDAHRRAAKLTAVQELRRARHALDTADLGIVPDAAAALLVLEALHPPLAPTDPEYSPPEEPPDLRRAPPSWDGNADMRFGGGE